jgi:hypothetical protein
MYPTDTLKGQFIRWAVDKPKTVVQKEADYRRNRAGLTKTPEILMNDKKTRRQARPSIQSGRTVGSH